MVTMATELFMVTPNTIDTLKGHIYVLNTQKGTCSGVLVDNRHLFLWMNLTVFTFIFSYIESAVQATTVRALP